MAESGWGDFGLTPVPGEPGCFTAHIDDCWMLFVVPQGGAVAAIAALAMRATLDEPDQTMRSMSVVFAGQVAGGAVEIDVGVLRRGRSMSQLTATVRSPGSAAGLTAVAVFGASRKGFEFTELRYPDFDGPDGLRSFRDGVPEGIDFEF